MDILSTLINLQRTQSTAIEEWFTKQRQVASPHLTNSVDLRHNELRLVPVDSNIYPAGFQNLSVQGRRRASIHFESGIKSSVADAKRVLIVPESHTRNTPYIENLKALEEILHAAGFEVELGSLIATADAPLQLTGQDGTVITGKHMLVKNQLLQTDTGFIPDVIVLNHDGSAGMPEIFKHIKQPILPSPEYGWFQRRKSCHFREYAALSEAFAEQFHFDPWLIGAMYDCVRGIDFKTREGVDHLAAKADALIARIKVKHQQYGIMEDPYIFVKADSGTYGMGIMVIRAGSELLEMNKKQRNKMHVVKDGREVHDVILQEGIKTVDHVQGKPAEPMVYLVDGMPVGGMFRVNAERDAFGNLNAAGMEYIGMCDENEIAKGAHQVAGCDFSAYGIIAAISSLAAAREGYGAGSHCDKSAKYCA